MAAVERQINGLNVFNMHFNQTILLDQLIRSGNQKEPVHADLRVGNLEEVFEDAMGNPDGPEPAQVDFRVDQDGFILPNLSSGLSLYTIEEAFPPKFDLNPRKLWNLNAGNPFPFEMQIRWIGHNHYGIIPLGGGVIPDTFKKMLKCLPWVKRYTESEVKEKEAAAKAALKLKLLQK